MDNDAIREAMARAMAPRSWLAEGKDYDMGTYKVMRESSLADAGRALTALTAELHRQGLVIVPREATEDMRIAAVRAHVAALKGFADRLHSENRKSAAAAVELTSSTKATDPVWDAMIAASEGRPLEQSHRRLHGRCLMAGENDIPEADFQTALLKIARGRADNGRPLSGEAARQIARRALTKHHRRWRLKGAPVLLDCDGDAQ